MPVNFSYTGDGGVLVKSEGVLKGSEIKEANDIIYESPQKIREIKYQICDFLSMDDVSISKREIQQIAMQDKRASEINPNMLIAIVAKTDLGFGLSRMWEALAYESSLKTMVFREMSKARQWIKENLESTP